MHPNVRGASGDTCNECGMSLVAIPDRTDASYWLDVASKPAAIEAGKPVRLHITVRDRATNESVSRLDVIHEKLMHLFIVSTDLRHFEHVHPEPAPEGSFEIPLTFAAPGAYRIVADFLPTGAMPQTLQHTIMTAGAGLPIIPSAASPTVESLEAENPMKALSSSRRLS
jgi:hypothetical protein